MWLYQDHRGESSCGEYLTGEAIRATETGTPLHACAANHKVPGQAPQFC